MAEPPPRPPPELRKRRTHTIRVQGRCPRGCGETLFVGDGGYVTCSWRDCPDPGAANTLLTTPPLPMEEAVDFSPKIWSRAVDQHGDIEERAINDVVVKPLLNERAVREERLREEREAAEQLLRALNPPFHSTAVVRAAARLRALIEETSSTRR